MATQPPRSNLQVRLISAAVLLPVLVGVVWIGGMVVAAVAAVVALIAQRELVTLIERARRRPLTSAAVVWTAATVFSATFGGDVVLMVAGAGALAALAGGLANERSVGVLRDWLTTTVGVAYIALPLASVVLIRDGDAGVAWLVLAFGATFATDTGAYAVGRAIGKHKMAPSISPGKTWEGAVGGLIAAVAAAIGIVALMDGIADEFLFAGLLGFGIGVIGQVGDLLESKIKRLADVKDSGAIIPGHGGMLDRLDSLVAVFPLVYYASRVWPAA